MRRNESRRVAAVFDWNQQQQIALMLRLPGAMAREDLNREFRRRLRDAIADDAADEFRAYIRTPRKLTVNYGIAVEIADAD